MQTKQAKRAQALARAEEHDKLSVKEKVIKSSNRRGLSMKETIRNLYPLKGNKKERDLILRTRVVIVECLRKALANGEDVWKTLYFNAIHHPQDWDRLEGSHLSIEP